MGRSFPRGTTAGTCSRGMTSSTSYRRVTSRTGGYRAMTSSTGSPGGTTSRTSYQRVTSMTGGPLRTNSMTGGSLRGKSTTGGPLRTKSVTGGPLRTNSMTGGPLGTNALESLIPTSPLAAMVPVIKILVIVPTNLVSAPFRMLSLKIIPVFRMSLIPRIPPRRIPVIGSDDIDLRICVIRSKSISRAEKVIQDPIHEPITFVKGPGRIIPNPRCHCYGTRGGRCIDLRLGKCGHRADRASSQQNYQHQKQNWPFHIYPRKLSFVCPMNSGVASSLRVSVLGS